MDWSVREGVELFHLAFLAQLSPRLGKDRFVIKGGCNLRFYFKSVRYSEDLDLDVENVSRETLKKAVEHVLKGRGLAITLTAAGIAVTGHSAAKQTDTTQRWKVALEVSGMPARSKVEFSRRGITLPAEFGPADPALTTRYGLTPLLATHYTRASAVRQKVAALVGRTEPQARDVFDLHLLLGGDAQNALALSERERNKATERALSIGFDAFKSQVVAYLPPQLQEHYASERVWDEMVLRVTDALGGRVEAD